MNVALGALARPRIDFQIANLAEATRCLSRNGIPHQMREGRILVAPEHAAGVELSFAP